MEGKVSRIIGAVVDVEFTDTTVPKIHDAIKVPMEDGRTIWLETARLLPDNTVRCISLNATEGMFRGMKAIATGRPITVNVGE